MNKIEITSHLNSIKSEIESQVNSGDVQAVQDKLIKLSSLVGLSAELMKECKGLVLYSQKEIINKEAERGLPASILTKKIEAELWEEIALLTYCDRLNAALVHSIDALRSVLSLYKTELQNSQYQQ